MQILGTGKRHPGDKYFERIIKAFGLEGKNVRKLVLTFEVNSQITVQYENFAEKEQMDKLMGLLPLNDVANLVSEVEEGLE